MNPVTKRVLHKALLVLRSLILVAEMDALNDVQEVYMSVGNESLIWLCGAQLEADVGTVTLLHG